MLAEMTSSPPPTPPKRAQSGLRFASLGIEMVLPIVLFMYVGYRLDLHFETTPWLFLAGAFVGIAVGFYSMFKRVGILGSKSEPKDGS